MQTTVAHAVSNGHAVSNSQYNTIGQDESRLEQAEQVIKLLHSYYSRIDNNSDAGSANVLSSTRLEVMLLEAYLDMCRSAKSERKSKLEHAVGILTTILKQNREHYGASLAIAVALGLTGQHAKAKNQFRRVSVSTAVRYSHGNNDNLVDLNTIHIEGMLVCQAYIIGKNKYDEYKEAFLLCLKQCKFSVRAHVALGELEASKGNYPQAWAYYQQAWNLCNEHDPQIGYQYAAMCVKNRKYVEAVRISQKIAYEFKDFAKIKKEIEDVAKSLIRSAK